MNQDATQHVRLNSATEGVPLAQRQAIAAYHGGYISLSKLAKVMGMHVLALRQ
jgi:hypothetical protein